MDYYIIVINRALSKLCYVFSAQQSLESDCLVFLFFFCLLASDLGLFGEQLLAARQDGSLWVPTSLKESRVFP